MNISKLIDQFIFLTIIIIIFYISYLYKTPLIISKNSVLYLANSQIDMKNLSFFDKNNKKISFKGKNATLILVTCKCDEDIAIFKYDQNINSYMIVDKSQINKMPSRFRCVFMPKFEMIELSKKGFSIFNVVNGDINRQ
jgi:hypothetical protein